MTRKPSEEGQKQPGAGPLGAEELYRRYLTLRAERDKSHKAGDHPVAELKKADREGILS